MIKRVIKMLLLFLSAALALFLFYNLIGGALCNDLRASRLEKSYAALPLPPQTERVEAASFVGNTSGTGNHTEIWAGMLVRSSLSKEELCRYFPDDDISEPPFDEIWMRFYALRQGAPEEGLFVIGRFYDACTQADLRGH